MAVVLQELKRIFNPIIIGIIIVLTALYYFLYLYYPIEHFENNLPAINYHKIAAEMIGIHGNSLTEDEFEDYILAKHASLEQEFELKIEENTEISESGISNYDDFLSLRDRYNEGEKLTHTQEKTLTYLDNFSSYDNIVWWLEATRGMIDDYISFGEISGSNSILDDYTYGTTVSYFRQLTIIVILTTIVLIGPLVIHDRKKGIHYLQYSSKTGRKLFKYQLVAAILASFILTTIYIAFFGYLISKNNLSVFLDSQINSFLNRDFKLTFYPFTFGQYIGLHILFTYILSSSITLITFIISRYSETIVAMVSKLLPVFLVTSYFLIMLMQDMFTTYNSVFKATNLNGVELIFIFGLALIAWILVIIIINKEKSVDVD